MRFYICILLFPVFVLCGARSEASDGRNYYAVIIGVDRYQHLQSGLSPLKFVKNDVEAITGMLLSLGWERENIEIIAGERATKRNLISVFDGWLRRLGPRDILFVYWAGHGYPDLADQRRVYFACYDTDLKKPWTGYRMDKVVRSIKGHGIVNVVFVADTCHAGKIATRSGGSKGLSIQPYLEDIPSNKNIPEGWIFMAATEAGHQAVENRKFENGIFTYCFVQAVKNHKTLKGVRRELVKRVPIEAEKVTDAEVKPVVVTTSADEKIWDMTLDLRGNR